MLDPQFSPYARGTNKKICFDHLKNIKENYYAKNISEDKVTVQIY